MWISPATLTPVPANPPSIDMLHSRMRPPTRKDGIRAIPEQRIRLSKQHLALRTTRPQPPQCKEYPKLRKSPKLKKPRRYPTSDSPTTSEFVSIPSLQKRAFSRPLLFKIAAWPEHLQDEIVAPPIATSSIRLKGVMLIFDLFDTFVTPEEPDIPAPNACICAAIRIFDACLGSSEESLMEWKRNPMVAGACWMITTKLLEVHPSPSPA